LRFAASMTTTAAVGRAIDELIAGIDGQVTPGMVDVAFLFASAHFEEDLLEVVERVGAALPNSVISGCTAEGTIGVEHEVERSPSISLLAASLQDVIVRPFFLSQADLERADTVDAWERLIGVSPESSPAFIAFADPFSVDAHRLLNRLNELFPEAPLIGGMASAGHAPGENRLIAAGEIVREGVVGVSLAGEFRLSTVVSQGCRPIARTFIITRGEHNVIRELSGKPALEQLQTVLAGLSSEDERLARESLFLGRVIDERKQTFTRGDFLIHNLLGADRKTGAIGIGGQARVGATVQFHVRDAQTADEDLHSLLRPHADSGVCGAMLFGCNGRGRRMWPQPSHDIGVLRQIIGPVPVAGFFCGGEFGPVGGRNFIHGYTASIALFRKPPEKAARPEA